MAKYKAYSEYRDSGVEWLGDIPSHWRTSKLRYMFNFGKGLTITKENLQDDGIPCISYGEIHSKHGFEVSPKIHPLKYVDEKYLKDNASSLLLKGDIVFADTSEDIDGSGNFSQLISDDIIFAGYHTIIAKPSNRKNWRFYAYILDCKELRTQVKHAVKGVKVFSITQAILRGLSVWLPTDDEQEKIVTFLDRETAKIDNLIEKQQQLIELLKEKRQAVISHAVTKGLNPDVPMKDSGIEWLDSIPSSWEVKPTYAICSASTEKNTDGLENNVLSLSYGNIIKRKTDTNFGLLPDSFNTYQIVKDGDIILRLTDLQNDKNSLRVGLVTQSGIITPAYLKLSVKHAITPSFSYYLLHTYDIFKVFYGMGGGLRQSMKFEDFRRLPLLIPSKIEQESIVTFIDKRIIKIDILIEKQLQQIALLKERRTALISAAVTGKIDVRHWRAPNEQTTDEAEAAQ
ncbi:restriction endonuclease subunit S [Citrobacter portucalensis]|uniref:restriction endonuclease subunit S n=1 Tax=Citrobacter portucalensis TaxID=1639133 RepID=UPI001ABF41CF|nr:restriction endonuclease subunit S [Citrobacter portucalensis]